MREHDFFSGAKEKGIFVKVAFMAVGLIGISIIAFVQKDWDLWLQRETAIFFDQISIEINPGKSPIDTLNPSSAYELAIKFTVKIYSENSWGSGFIVSERNGKYLVLTSKHLIESKKEYRVLTQDGILHNSKVIDYWQDQNADVALLEFTNEEQEYATAILPSLDSPSFQIGDKVFAAGFTNASDWTSPSQFTLVEGEVVLILNETLIDGYQIGSSNDLRTGMSGGPLLNSRGEVIGINGIGKYPLLVNAYIFSDGTLPSEEMIERMQELSWSIPLSEPVMFQ